MEGWQRGSEKGGSFFQSWFGSDTSFFALSNGAIVQGYREQCYVGCHDCGCGHGVYCRIIGIFIEYVADATGQIFQAVFIGAAVFLLGAAATYVRLWSMSFNVPIGISKLVRGRPPQLHHIKAGRLSQLYRRLYKQAGSQDTQDIATESHGSNM
ncbi:Aluminum-activated malate transporter [Sesbania bispinosa]|nr:Aluminum-activated malate transporter [Sesbania bispinosa]